MASIPASENHFGGAFSRPEGSRERLWGAAPGPAATGGAPREPGSDFDRAGCSGLTPPRGAPGVPIDLPSPWPPPPVRLLFTTIFTTIAQVLPARVPARLSTHTPRPACLGVGGLWRLYRMGGLGAGLGLQSCPISGRRYSASGGRGPTGCGAAANDTAHHAQDKTRRGTAAGVALGVWRARHRSHLSILLAVDCTKRAR